MSNNEPAVIPKIVMGTFDPETRWRDPALARLPAMPDKDRQSIVLCMDELLFPFCGPDDVLYTRCKIDPALHEYLNGLGLSFRTRYHFDLNDENKPLPKSDDFKRCMFSLAAEQAQNLIPAKRTLQTAAAGYSKGVVLPESIPSIYAAGGLRQGQSPDEALFSPTPHRFYRRTLLRQKRKLTFMLPSRLIHYRTR
ncbi:hypothetical protein [Paenibacillus sp. NPDC093718]|uniref:hypothetical protein n=1 Tax=Paenibacillus sp. NPDC093718 TaxID=3390601 RepID=UPI003D019DF8